MFGGKFYFGFNAKKDFLSLSLEQKILYIEISGATLANFLHFLNFAGQAMPAFQGFAISFRKIINCGCEEVYRRFAWCCKWSDCWRCGSCKTNWYFTFINHARLQVQRIKILMSRKINQEQSFNRSQRPWYLALEKDVKSASIMLGLTFYFTYSMYWLRTSSILDYLSTNIILIFFTYLFSQILKADKTRLFNSAHSKSIDKG